MISAHRVNVLGRRALPGDLLPQPGGFEGLCLIVVVPNEHDLAVAVFGQHRVVRVSSMPLPLPLTIILNREIVRSSPTGRIWRSSILQLSQLSSHLANQA